MDPNIAMFSSFLLFSGNLIAILLAMYHLLKNVFNICYDFHDAMIATMVYYCVTIAVIVSYS